MKISIIVPIFNSSEHLVKCIESIVNQTHNNIEIILINDGSTDKSGAIADRYAELDERIVVIHSENKGVSSARNLGLKLATGDYIGFVDSDDFIKLNMYKNLIDIAIKENVDVVQCGFQYVSEENKLKNKLVYPNMNLQTKDEVLRAYFQTRKINPVLWNKIYKRSVIKEIKMIEGRNHEDSMAIPEILLNCNTLINTSEAYYYYVQGDETIMSSEFTEKSMDQLYAGDYVIELCKRENKDYLIDAYITSSLDCILLYQKLEDSKMKERSQYQNRIISTFNRNYKKIFRSEEMKKSSIKIKIAVHSFKINKKLSITLLKLFESIKKRREYV